MSLNSRLESNKEEEELRDYGLVLGDGGEVEDHAHYHVREHRLRPEREFLVGNLLVRIHLIIDDFSRPALRHGSLTGRRDDHAHHHVREHRLRSHMAYLLKVYQSVEAPLLK
jgi:hypothetical protein